MVARDLAWWIFHDKHPHTTRQAVAAGFFPSYPIANRRFIRLKKRKRGRKPRIVGLVAFSETGRAAYVYCAWRPAHIEHEVKLTGELIKLPIPLDLWKRGGQTDRKLRPDAELPNLYVEFDNGTEKKPQVQRQVKAYHQTNKLCLWIVPSERQYEWIKEVGKKETTVVLLNGRIYDLFGRTVGVEEWCRKILSLIQQPVRGT